MPDRPAHPELLALLARLDRQDPQAIAARLVAAARTDQRPPLLQLALAVLLELQAQPAPPAPRVRQVSRVQPDPRVL